MQKPAPIQPRTSPDKFAAWLGFASPHLGSFRLTRCTAGCVSLRARRQSMQSWLCSWRREKSPHGNARKSRSLDKSPHGWSRARSLEASGCEDLLDSISGFRALSDACKKKMGMIHSVGFDGFLLYSPEEKRKPRRIACSSPSRPGGACRRPISPCPGTPRPPPLKAPSSPGRRGWRSEIWGGANMRIQYDFEDL